MGKKIIVAISVLIGLAVYPSVYYLAGGRAAENDFGYGALKEVSFIEAITAGHYYEGYDGPSFTHDYLLPGKVISSYFIIWAVLLVGAMCTFETRVKKMRYWLIPAPAAMTLAGCILCLI